MRKYIFPSTQERSLDIDPVLLEAAAEGRAVRVQLPIGSEAWLVTGHGDVAQLYRDRRFERAGLDSEQAPRTMRNILLQQGSFGGASGRTLTRIRSATRRLLSRETVGTLRDEVDELAQRLIDDLVRRDECDLVADLAEVVPMNVICKILGISVDLAPEIRSYTSHLLRAAHSDEDPEKALSGKEIASICRILLDAMRHPEQEDTGLQKIIEDERLALNDQEILTIGFGLLMAGFETTAIVLGKILLRLATAPAELALLRQNGVTAHAVDEYLRIISVSAGDGLPWRAAEGCSFAGVNVRQGDYIVPAVGTANRDPEVFDSPEGLDLGRKNANNHLTFGSGEHFCLGSDIARMEIRSILTALCNSVETISLKNCSEPTWKTDHVLWSLERLPARLLPLPGGRFE